MRALRSLGPAPDDPPTVEADLFLCSASRGKYTANSQKDKLKTSRKRDGNGKLTSVKHVLKCAELRNDDAVYTWFRNEEKHTANEENNFTPQTRRPWQPARGSRHKISPY